MENPHFREIGVFDGQVRSAAGATFTALDTPVVRALRVADPLRTAPAVGENNDLLEPKD